jgi:glycosyltransferase involved in cell wall biosynthesis
MFSVLIPAFKIKYLPQAIDSILKQKFTDFEIIIVNDKSPEDIYSIVSTYSDKRIKYYENEKNLGKIDVVGNWNKCLSHATKEYAILFSDDDMLDDTYLFEISILIKRYPAVDVFYSRVGVIDAENSLIRTTPSAPEFETCLDFIWHRVFGYREIFAQNFTFKTNALREQSGFVDFPLAWGTDDATWFTLAARNGVVSTNKILCYWRWSELNISNVGSVDLRISAVGEFFSWLKNFVEGFRPIDKSDALLQQLILKKIPDTRKAYIQSLIDILFKSNTWFQTLKKFNVLRKGKDLEYTYLLVGIKRALAKNK